MIYPMKRVPVYDRDGDLNVTCPFGERIHPITGKVQFHTGVDCTRWTGGSDVSGIVAIQAGKVTRVVRDVKGYSDEQISGNFVEVEHGQGYVSRYCHLQYESIPEDIQPGVKISKGTYLGFMGETGRCTGIHLHFTLLRYGELIDPLDYLRDLKQVPAPDKYCTIEMQQIRKGYLSKPVSTLQMLLKELGYRGKDGRDLTLDGNFGTNTEFAVLCYQRDHGLVEDGIVGKNTWTMLLT